MYLHIATLCSCLGRPYVHLAWDEPWPWRNSTAALLDAAICESSFSFFLFFPSPSHLKLTSVRSLSCRCKQSAEQSAAAQLRWEVACELIHGDGLVDGFI